MSEIYGWAGRILKVDLTRGKIEMVDSLDYVHKYLGGKGMNHRLGLGRDPAGDKGFRPGKPADYIGRPPDRHTGPGIGAGHCQRGSRPILPGDVQPFGSRGLGPASHKIRRF